MAEPLAQEDQIKEGEMHSYNTRIGRVALTRLNGKICAFENTCTHDGGSLEGGHLEGKEVVCPRHGARFDIETGAATRADTDRFGIAEACRRTKISRGDSRLRR